MPLHCGRDGVGAATRSRWSKPRRCGHGELDQEWMGKQQRFEKKVRVVIFYFYFRADSSVACWNVRTSKSTNARPDETNALNTTLSFFFSYKKQSGKSDSSHRKEQLTP
jgi:hypothetical protein